MSLKIVLMGPDRRFLKGKDLVDAPAVETVTVAENERFSPEAPERVDTDAVDTLSKSSACLALPPSSHAAEP